MISHVLVVENHRMMREALKGLLEPLGIQRLVVVSDPIDAVQLIMRQPPQLVLLDASPTWADTRASFLSRMFRAMAPQMLIAMLVDDDSSLYCEIKASSRADFVIGKAHLVQQLPEVLRGTYVPDYR